MERMEEEFKGGCPPPVRRKSRAHRPLLVDLIVQPVELESRERKEIFREDIRREETESQRQYTKYPPGGEVLRADTRHAHWPGSAAYPRLWTFTMTVEMGYPNAEGKPKTYKEPRRDGSHSTAFTAGFRVRASRKPVGGWAAIPAPTRSNKTRRQRSSHMEDEPEDMQELLLASYVWTRDGCQGHPIHLRETTSSDRHSTIHSSNKLRVGAGTGGVQRCARKAQKKHFTAVRGRRALTLDEEPILENDSMSDVH
jgi:hypothetical protein